MPLGSTPERVRKSRRCLSRRSLCCQSGRKQVVLTVLEIWCQIAKICCGNLLTRTKRQDVGLEIGQICMGKPAQKDPGWRVIMRLWRLFDRQNQHFSHPWVASPEIFQRPLNRTGPSTYNELWCSVAHREHRPLHAEDWSGATSSTV